jgi:hypothetical protein
MPIICTNDIYIKEILDSDKYDIRKDGTCWIFDARKKNWKRWDKQYKRKRNEQDLYWNVSYRGHKISVHRIIYAKFVGELSKHLSINHLDGNPSNNTPGNLELVTQRENNLYSYRVLNKKPVKGHKKISKELADLIRFERSCGLKYKDLVEKYKLCKSTISYIVNRKTWIDGV